ncbi:MAG TPA: ATP-binding protein [Bryobacteraceae bacterium]|nr:ATP-binding protein [Bryobacteraceae bacterium]
MRPSATAGTLLRVALFCIVLAFPLASQSRAGHVHPPIKNVLILFPEESWSAPVYQTVYNSIKQLFDETLEVETTLFGESLDLYLFADEAGQKTLAEFLTKKYGRIKIDLVIPVAPSSLNFLLRSRDGLFPGIPIVYCGDVAHRDRRLEHRSDITGTAATIDIPGTIELARSLHPGLQRIAVVAGTGMLDGYVLALFHEAFKSYEGQLELIDLSGLFLDSLMDRISRLPASTAILYISFQRDGEGRIFSSSATLRRVSQVANAPVFNFIDAALGYGSVGGSMTQVGAVARKTGEIALQVLTGESPAAIAPVVVGHTPAMFDWRQLKRWGIEESALPPGSIVCFKERSLWEEFRWWIVGACAFACCLALFTVMLASNLMRRKRAEREAAEMRHNLVHVARVSTVGQLGQTIAHEINQPLAAMRMNAEVACQLLAESPPNLKEAHAALGDIVADSKRVQEVVASVRSLVQNRQTERTRLGLNRVAADTIQLMRALAESKGVDVRLELQADLPPVDGDKVQLQQLVMNLVQNAVESVSEDPLAPRLVRVRTSREPDGDVELSVLDTGPGVDPETARHLFAPLFSTKPEGLGLGLSICRTIAEAHGGSLKLASSLKRGAAFVLRLPAAHERRREPRSERPEP